MSENKLTKPEAVQLEELESSIQTGLKNFVEVGNALLQIRDGKLYRQTHKTFEDYCRKRWAMARRTAYQYIEAAKVSDNLCATAHKPETESVARPLTKLPPDEQAVAWQKAQEIAKEEDKPVGARHVEMAVDSVQNEECAVPAGGSMPDIKDLEASAKETAKDHPILFHLKSYWRQASKRNRRLFLEWVTARGEIQQQIKKTTA